MGITPSTDGHTRMYTAPAADRRAQPSSRQLPQEASPASPALRRHCGGMAREEAAVRTKPYSKPILSCKRTHTDSPDVAVVVMVGRHHQLLAPDHIQRMQVSGRNRQTLALRCCPNRNPNLNPNPTACWSCLLELPAGAARWCCPLVLSAAVAVAAVAVCGWLECLLCGLDLDLMMILLLSYI